jgi:glutamine phosphoribosylpyrophosphate amidotransferase
MRRDGWGVFMSGVNHECGVVGLYLKDCSQSSNLVPATLIGVLRGLQHRGQKSAGISVYDPFCRAEPGKKIIETYKGLGGVSSVFKLDDDFSYGGIVDGFLGVAGIGHNRYSTSGDRRHPRYALHEVQPFERPHGRRGKMFSLAFNGNVANYESLRRKIEGAGYWLHTRTDTEILMHLLSLNCWEQEVFY